jgi:large subunit ribosomal protein L15
MVRKDKKIYKLRGTRTCGRGYNDRARSKGTKGGKGNAGSKDHKRLHYLKLYGPSYFGRPKGFINQNPNPEIGINVGDLDILCTREKKKEIDISELGYTRLLGAGLVSTPLTITTPHASKKAVEKVEAAGGKVILPEEVPETAKPSSGGKKEQQEAGGKK